MGSVDRLHVPLIMTCDVCEIQVFIHGWSQLHKMGLFCSSRIFKFGIDSTACGIVASMVLCMERCLSTETFQKANSETKTIGLSSRVSEFKSGRSAMLCLSTVWIRFLERSHFSKRGNSLTAPGISSSLLSVIERIVKLEFGGMTVSSINLRLDKAI